VRIELSIPILRKLIAGRSIYGNSWNWKVKKEIPDNFLGAIMPLQSKLFKGDQALEACLIQDSAHIIEGAAGEHVAKIHTALFAIDGLAVSPDELRNCTYGKSTVKAVLEFKTKRNIINYSYERQVDNIVGKMTIAALDKEMLRKEAEPRRRPDPWTYDFQTS
jgi:hypothetical protein